VYASRTRTEEFSGHDENCQQNVLELKGSLVTSSRLPGRPQKRPDDRITNGGVVAQAADGSQRTVGAADEQCRLPTSDVGGVTVLNVTLQYVKSSELQAAHHDAVNSSVTRI